LTRIEWFPRHVVAEVPFAVDHDEEALHPGVLAAPVELIEILLVLSLVLEELVHVLHGVDPELLLRHLGEVEVGHLAGAEGAVQGPLREGDVEELILVVGGLGHAGENSETRDGGCLEEVAALHDAAVFRRRRAVSSGKVGKNRGPVPAVVLWIGHEYRDRAG
jgi:hypothetical protein